MEDVQRAFKTEAIGYHFTIFNLAGREEGRSFGSKEPISFATNAARLIRQKTSARAALIMRADCLTTSRRIRPRRH